MTADKFSQLWTVNYADLPPLPHLLRQRHPMQWARVHSLPASMRYPENAAEWAILLERQLTILADIVGDPADALVITGYYTSADTPDLTGFIAENAVFEHTHFTPLTGVEMRDFPDPREPDDNLIYWPLLAHAALSAGFIVKLLRAIANEESMAFFVNRHNAAVVAPYAGGVDLFLPDSSIRDYYKHKYRAWLSDREDGL